MKAILTVGLPGSGKSTWAKKFCEENTDYVRICRDDLRNMRGKYWLPKQEDLITSFVKHLVADCARSGKNVILDETNLNKARRDELLTFLKMFEFECELKEFNTSPEECIKRDLARPNSVGADVIWNMFYSHVQPTEKIEYDPNLLDAVIFDIDGTLALNTSGRSPFAWGEVGKDSPNEPILALLDACRMFGYKIIIFSGRDSTCQKETEQWLANHGIEYKMLCMRYAGDMRKDAVVKKEMFYGSVHGKYNVKFVVDDRDQVVRMWRKELGLTCLQVNYGNF